MDRFDDLIIETRKALFSSIDNAATYIKNVNSSQIGKTAADIKKAILISQEVLLNRIDNAVSSLEHFLIIILIA